MVIYMNLQKITAGLLTLLLLGFSMTGCNGRTPPVTADTADAGTVAVSAALPEVPGPMTDAISETVTDGVTETDAPTAPLPILTEAPTDVRTEAVTEAPLPVQTEAAAEAVTEPAAKPVTAPVTEAVTEPVTASVTEAVTEPVTAPVTEADTEAVVSDGAARVSFGAVGDAIVHEGIWMEAQKTARLAGQGEEYDFSHLFQTIGDDIAAYDLAFVNQETLMAGAEYGYSAYPRFNTPRELADELIEVGFDVVNIANNHMMDMLPEGLAATIDFWNTKPVTLIGGYKNKTDYDTARIVEKNGIEIAFLSYCYGTNGLSMPAGYDMIIPYLDEEVIRAQTAAAHEKADFVVVSVHWGEDSYQGLTAQQKTFAQIFADCGVDVVLGHHPHLIQPVEWIEGRDGHRMLCAYSLGNFFSLMAKAENMVGGLLSLDFVLDGDEKRLENVQFDPIFCYYKMSFFGQNIIYQKDYTEEMAKGHGVQNYAVSNNKTAAQLIAYTRSLISEEFLPDDFPS